MPLVNTHPLCCSTIQIEADLRFCEDVLNSATQLPSKLPRRVGSAGAAVVGRHVGAALAAAAPPAKQSPLGQQQQQRTPRKQRPPPLRPRVEQAAEEAPLAATAGPVGPTARTHEELMDMLTSVPEGQPFEIDTRLLYSPQSSYVTSGESSPSGRSASQEGHVLGGSAADAFSLPAYRPSTDGRQPLYADLGQAASALGPLPGGGGSSSPWRQQQHTAGPRANPQQQQQLQSSSRLRVRSPAGGPRPASAPLWNASGSQGGSPASSGGRHSRQLLLDDVVAEGSVQGRTAGECLCCTAAALRVQHFLRLRAGCHVSFSRCCVTLHACPPPRPPAELLRWGREERLQQLAQPRTELWQRCANIRVQEERAELQVGGTGYAGIGGTPLLVLSGRAGACSKCCAVALRCGVKPASKHPPAAPTPGTRSARLLPARAAHLAGSAWLQGCLLRIGWRCRRQGGRRRWNGLGWRRSGRR